MKKRIINVVEVTTETLLGIESFVINNDLEEKERVQAAEELFIKKAIENGMEDSEEEKEYALDNGHYENGDYTVYLSWSN